MRVADTSVVVAAFASWHELHSPARAAIASGVRLITHVAVEAYSVLTRLPPPYRLAPEPVNRYLRETFTTDWLQLPPGETATLLALLSEAGMGGGAVYDGLIGLVAARHDATLLSFDRRARPIYELCGAQVEVPQ